MQNIIIEDKPKTNAVGLVERSRVFFNKYHWLVALVLYSFISLVITFPLIFHLNSSVIGTSPDGDNLQNAWDLWWFKYAILHGENPDRTNLLYGLLPSIQIFVWTYTNAIMAFFLQFIIGTVTTYNVVLLLGFFLAGFTTYLLAGEFFESKLVRFACGFFFDFCNYHFFRANGHLGLSTIQVLPFCAWTVFLFYRKPNVKRALLAGLGMALILLTDAYLMAYFLIPFLIVFVVWVLATNFSWVLKWRNLLLTALAGLVTLVLSFPMLISFIVVDPDVQESSKVTAKVTTSLLSADLLAFFFPISANPFLGRIFGFLTNDVAALGEKTVFLGFTVVLLTLISFFFRENRNKYTLFWVAFGLFTLVLTLGPQLHIGGKYYFDLPTYDLVFGWSSLSSFRAPGRMGISTMLAFSLLAGGGLNSINQLLIKKGKAKGRWFVNGLAVGLMTFSIFEHSIYALPLMVQPISVPALYTEIEADKSDAMVLDLPVLPSTGFYMFSQTIHLKKMVTGYPPRITQRMLDSVRTLPDMEPFLNTDLVNNPQYLPNDIFPNNKLTFYKSLAENNIGYVLLHYRPELSPEKNQWMQNFLLDKLGTPVYDNPQEKLVAWKIDRTNPALKNNADLSYEVGSGWLPGKTVVAQKPARTVQQDGQLLITTPVAQTKDITFTTVPVLKPFTLEVRLNGQVVKTVNLANAWHSYDIDLGQLQLQAGKNILEFHAPEGCIVPAKIDPKNNDPRCFFVEISDVQVR